MALNAKRHQNTARLSIHEGERQEGRVWRGPPQRSAQSGAAMNWRRVAISDTVSVCFPDDKGGFRGNPPLSDSLLPGL